MERTYKEIYADEIKVNKNQPRTNIDEQSLNELTLSIKENGLLQPIIVIKVKENEYMIVAGERRFRACKKAGLIKIPCIVSNYDDKEVDIMALIENIQRENLSVIEEAKAYKNMIDTYGYTQNELSEIVGKKQSTIANKLRLLKLSTKTKNALDNKTISERHGRALLKLNTTTQDELVDKIIEKELTVIQLEKLINKKPKPRIINKGYVGNMKIAINTINQSVGLVKNTGLKVEQELEDLEDEVIITIKIKK